MIVIEVVDRGDLCENTTRQQKRAKEFLCPCHCAVIKVGCVIFQSLQTECVFRVPHTARSTTTCHPR